MSPECTHPDQLIKSPLREVYFCKHCTTDFTPWELTNRYPHLSTKDRTVTKKDDV